METEHKFTTEIARVLVSATELAQRYKQSDVDTEYLLYGLIDLGDTAAFRIIQNVGIDPQAVKSEIVKIIENRKQPETEQIPDVILTRASKQILSDSYTIAQDLNGLPVQTEHLLLALLRANNGLASQVLLNLGVDTESIEAHIKQPEL